MVKTNNVKRCLVILLITLIICRLFYYRPAAQSLPDTPLKTSHHRQNHHVIQHPIQSRPQSNGHDSFLNQTPIQKPDKIDPKLLSMGLQMMSIKEKKQYIRHKNRIQTVINSGLVPTSSSHDKFDLVIVIQSHRRYQYLDTLFKSMQKARDIGKVLLIVSHDYLLDEMREVVEKVKFCPVSKYSSSLIMTCYCLLHLWASTHYSNVSKVYQFNLLQLLIIIVTNSVNDARSIIKSYRIIRYSMVS